MKSITINGSQRESVGKKATKALRNAGQVPCVLYGGDKPVHFSAAELAFSKLVYTPNAHTVVIELEGGTVFNAILQDIQFHPVTDNILHVDFYQVFEDKEITMDIPLNFIGNPRGVRSGGVLRKNRRSLRVKALPGNLPDFIDANIEDLKIGNKLYITKLENEAYTFMHPDNTVVCLVRRSRAAVTVDDDDDEEDADDVPATETDDVAAVKD
ncbi:MAG: large subunit ribosomal protein L25 [Olleya marilimosa]|jgi:large subunit ribosomal protein L25|uniref:Large ribosomal subunit protein bL25 n=1 Tax=Olleya marilimosa TaxID=272164 RepID=A0ABR8LTW1_9FLAO|nr:50S ribosomal protein L25/general stress protein Ctc [Olleya marilimosa]MBD3862818.1 50S ribosomal protein L25/general stress protein Ctc [Olleya marilimosa]MBD3890313.1 50S ribosomal protein L25/general stress protein Ctc [Olleya marilimosa]|tara:strand:+ start:229967 stop:230602 length:636 start_codon:yes stop_codon:yes gene_type:complete